MSSRSVSPVWKPDSQRCANELSADGVDVALSTINFFGNHFSIYQGSDIPVIVGGIIPDEDARKLESAGVRRVYTPKDFDLTAIMRDIVDIVAGDAS